MEYQSLKKVFHRAKVDSRGVADSEFSRRIDSPSTVHWDYQVGEHSLFAVVTRELAATLERIWRNEVLIAKLWTSVPDSASRLYLFELLTAELQSTNEIESIFSTRREIAEAIEYAQKEKHTGKRRFKEMASQYLALPGIAPDPHHSLTFPADPAALRAQYDALLQGEIHQQDSPDGALFRTEPVEITDGQRRIHGGAAGEEDITHRVETMIATANRGTELELLNVFAEHFMFEHTHPFYDGNGRMGRFLMSLRLAGLMSPQTALSLSPELFRQKSRYYKAFEDAEHPLNCGELTFFLYDMASMLATAQVALVEWLEIRLRQVEQLKQQMESVRELVSGHTKPEESASIVLQLALVDLFGARTGLSLDELTEHLGTSKPTTRKRLEELGPLIETVSKRPLVVRLGGPARVILGLD
ncbi:hypothetical protein CPHO_10010 [Corynebacterium phocae]|uniref:Fido domain-containing protein n=1 Tax=Corynebacterium phocae TaxID=161895 RepID=A0A1L7D528_9CORY|nr:Fic family protein [Corynebacterium phocae]APT93167.1 hypothetical protein CPHO_10010 [Corynebacterium phocae]KAA8722247.1 Fic family protein [Corynebacterium phocae]